MPRNKALLAIIVLPAITASSAPSGYIPVGSFDILPILAPAPLPGDARDVADRSIFRATRQLLGTPRGAMASDDVDRSPAAMLRDYACALDAELAPGDIPRTVVSIERASRDTVGQMNRAKAFYKRPRPLMVEPGPVCQPRARLEKSFDYPSGHTTGGYTWALILAELAPEHATAILARGRAFGESRLVCGAHSASAVAGGFFTASATLNAVHASPAFRADMKAARVELAAATARARKPDSARCAAERELVAQRIY